LDQLVHFVLYFQLRLLLLLQRVPELDLTWSHLLPPSLYVIREFGLVDV